METQRNADDGISAESVNEKAKQGGQGKDLVHFFNEDGLGAIVNSSRGIIAAYKKDTYAKYGEANYADASRQAVVDMIEDINSVL